MIKIYFGTNGINDYFLYIEDDKFYIKSIKIDNENNYFWPTACPINLFSEYANAVEKAKKL